MNQTKYLKIQSALTVFLFLVVSAPLAQAQARYLVQQLPPVAGTNNVNLGRLSNSGIILGHAYHSTNGNERGYVFGRNGKYLRLPTLGGRGSKYQFLRTLGGTDAWPADISSSGDTIVGSSKLPSGYSRASLWMGTNSPINLGTLPNTAFSSASGINDRGDIVGYSGSKPFRYLAGGTMQELPSLFSHGGWASNISNNSLIVGTVYDQWIDTRAIIWNAAGQARQLPELLPIESYASQITRSGRYVTGGSSTVSGYTHAVRWSAQNNFSVVTDLGVAPGFNESGATSINESGIAGGWSSNGLYLEEGVATLFLNGQAYNLNTLVDGLDVTFTLNTVDSINDRGQLAVRGTDPKLTVSAFILTPQKPLL